MKHRKNGLLRLSVVFHLFYIARLTYRANLTGLISASGVSELTSHIQIYLYLSVLPRLFVNVMNVTLNWHGASGLDVKYLFVHESYFNMYINLFSEHTQLKN